MENDTTSLSIRLFLVSLATDFFIPMLSVGKYTRAALGALASILYISALFWPLISPHAPIEFMDSLSSLATNAWAWFALLMGMLIVSSLFPIIKKIQDSRIANWLLGEEKLVIHYAGYGLGFGKYRDATEDIKRKVRMGRLLVQVENSLFSFPDPYAQASLILEHTSQNCRKLSA